MRQRQTLKEIRTQTHTDTGRERDTERETAEHAEMDTETAQLERIRKV